MAQNTITSANAIFTLVIPDLFPAPVFLQGFSTDDAFTTEDVEPAVTRMGVDGLMSAGFTPFITKIKVTLEADSPSIAMMDAWLSAMKAASEILYADATIVAPSLKRNYVCTKGVLSGAMQFPSAKKVFDPVPYTIAFEDVQPTYI